MTRGWRRVIVGAALVAAVNPLLIGYATQLDRRRAQEDNCRATNDRNRNTIATLDRLIAKAPASRRGEARANRAATVLFINDLAPFHSDCAAFARERVHVGL